MIANLISYMTVGLRDDMCKPTEYQVIVSMNSTLLKPLAEKNPGFFGWLVFKMEKRQYGRLMCGLFGDRATLAVGMEDIDIWDVLWNYPSYRFGILNDDTFVGKNWLNCDGVLEGERYFAIGEITLDPARCGSESQILCVMRLKNKCRGG